MTTKPTPANDTLRLPEAPHPEDIFRYRCWRCHSNGIHLAFELGNPEDTIVHRDVYLIPSLNSRQEDLLVPDLLIAFDVDPAAFRSRRGYVIDEQGKPPDFVLEIASQTTGRRDATVKRERYAAMGVVEYWRFDDTGGRYTGVALAGDRLVNGLYQPIRIEHVDEETWQGHSNVLNLDLRWEQGQLGWYDPDTGRHIIRFEDERARADNERTQATRERARADSAEARVRELEEEVRRLRSS